MSIIHTRHNDWSSRIGMWQLLWQSYTGGSDYIHAGNLFQHVIEDPLSYAQRLARAYYFNYCKPVVNIYNQFIFSAHVNRQLGGIKELEEFSQNASGRGQDIDTMLSIANKLSAVFGTCFAVVDIQNEGTPPIVTAVLEQKPFITILKPFSVIDWSIDDKGEFNWVKIKTEYVVDVDPSVQRVSEPRYVVWRKNTWEVYNKNGGIVDNGDNNLGVVPVVPINHYSSEDDDTILGESLIEDVALVNRALFNWCSLLDEILYEQTFSLLVMETKKSDKSITLTGTKRVFTYEFGTKVPQFISPDATQGTLILNIINKTIKEIYRLVSLERSGMVYKSEVSQSGESKEWDMVDTNQAIAAKAAVLAEAELNIQSLVYGYGQVKKGKKPFDSLWSLREILQKKKVGITYPKTFDTRGYLEELKTSFDLLAVDLSETFNKEYKKYLTTRALPNISTSVLEKIHKEIDSEKIHKEIDDGTGGSSNKN